MQIEVNHMFSAAHQLPDSEHLITKACASLHGHTYAVKVVGESSFLKGGMIVDFKGIKNIIDQLDHKFVNDIFKMYGWYDIQTTAENISRFLHSSINKQYPGCFTYLEVSVAEGYKGEGLTSWVRYQGESMTEL